NIKELRIKEKQKVSVVFISSIFKKNKNYLGKFRFMNLKKMTKRKVVALGGIKKENIKIVKVLNCFGYAGISFFKKKGPD
ncbi:thiamine phosphate synthase, partial [Candidatus Pelagibacter sp.]|nr:thiamine phosphate synthase [Candidatus Pelagibacter sp.]